MRDARPMISVDMMVLTVCIAGTAFLAGLYVGMTSETPCPNATGKVLLRDANGVCEYQKAGYGKAVWTHYKASGVTK